MSGKRKTERSDLEGLRRTREELRRSERDYRGLFEAAHDAIIIFRPEDELILDANGRASEIYRIPRDELVGMLNLAERGIARLLTAQRDVLDGN